MVVWHGKWAWQFSEGLTVLRFGMAVTLTISDHIDHLIIVIIIPIIIITAIGMTRIGLSSIFQKFNSMSNQLNTIYRLDYPLIWPAKNCPKIYMSEFRKMWPKKTSENLIRLMCNVRIAGEKNVNSDCRRLEVKTNCGRGHPKHGVESYILRST